MSYMSYMSRLPGRSSGLDPLVELPDVEVPPPADLDQNPAQPKLVAVANEVPKLPLGERVVVGAAIS